MAIKGSTMKHAKHYEVHLYVDAPASGTLPPTISNRCTVLDLVLGRFTDLEDADDLVRRCYRKGCVPACMQPMETHVRAALGAVTALHPVPLAISFHVVFQ
jgi:hypothetical protein